jgi:ABC-2 type transport system ATP-binding protein
MTPPYLELRSVVKQYAGSTAVNNVSLSIPKGCIYGLLGPNGAGKTSMIRMITRITEPDSGEILLDGKPLKEGDTEKMGYMPEERGLYRKMKVKDQIVYLLRLKGKKAADARKIADEWLTELDIKDWANKKISDLSKGMSQKIQFITTVAHNPDLIILDEPFSGLDPINSQLIENKMMELKARGHTILFSTHRMEQVEEFCDRIALVNHGKIVLEGGVKEVRNKFQQQNYRIWFEGDGSALRSIPGTTVLEVKEDNVFLKLNEGTSKDLLKKIASLDLNIQRFEHHLPRVSEIFIEVVNETSRKEVQHA